MKIIHCSDLHLDSRLESNLPTHKSRERKKEIIMAFCRMVDFAKEQGVSVVLIAGDLFDTNLVLSTTRDVILGKIADADGVEFLYLPGNHDKGSELFGAELPKNLKIFGKEWTTFQFGNIAVTGVELTEENCRHIYGSLKLSDKNFNIVTMHGDLGTDYGPEAVNRKELAEKSIDYLALGHYHTYRTESLGKNGVCCYSGCLEGRGFDEHGDKGFVLLDIADDGSFEYKFVKNSCRDIIKTECDLSGVSDTSEMLKCIDTATARFKPDAMVKVVLKGDLPVDARKDIEMFKKHLEGRFWFVKVSDETRIAINIEDHLNDISLKGEFIRKVMAADLPENIRDRVIECGLAALSGREVL